MSSEALATLRARFFDDAGVRLVTARFLAAGLESGESDGGSFSFGVKFDGEGGSCESSNVEPCGIIATFNVALGGNNICPFNVVLGGRSVCPFVDVVLGGIIICPFRREC